MSFNLQQSLEQIATQLSLDSNLLIGYAREDDIDGFTNQLPPDKRVWPLGAIWEVEGQILYALVRALEPALVVQAGTGYGCSATHIAQAMKINGAGKLITIDSDPGTGKWAQIPDGLRQEHIEFVIADAAGWMASGVGAEIDIFFQDATHHADGVRREILAILPHIKPGGLIITHDADHFVVGKQIMDGLKLAGLDATVYSTAPSDCGLAIWRKPGVPEPTQEFMATAVVNRTTGEFVNITKVEPVTEPQQEPIPSTPPVQMPDEVDMGIQPFTPEPVFEPRQELHRVPFTTTWIEEGKILAGSIPQLDEDLRSLRDMGIASIVSLTRRSIISYPFSPIEEKGWESIKRGEYDAVRDVMPKLPTAFDINQFAIPDGGLADDNIMLAAVNCLDACTKPVYIHCRGGIGRTGTILIAYYVLKRGMSLADARELVKVRRNHEGNASAIDQGSPQREWIDTLPDRLKSEPTVGYTYSDMSRKELIQELTDRGYILDDIDGTGKNGYVKTKDMITVLHEDDEAG